MMAAVKGPGVVGVPGAVALEPARRRVRVMAAGEWVADSDRAVLLFEHGFTPRWYLPIDDVRVDLLAVSGRTSDTLGRGVARWYDLTVGEHHVVDAAWDHPAPPPDCTDLAGMISFEWNLMDAWFEEDQEAFVHPRDPYTRVDVLPTSRRVTIEVAGTLIAETRRALMLIETTAPTRFYVPRLDVVEGVLLASDSFTMCPYKGRARYWHVRAGGTIHHDLLWEYPEPLHAVHQIVGHVCAFNEHADITVDGVRLDRPQTKWTYGGPNAYTFRAGDAAWDPTEPVDWRGDERSDHR